MHYRCAVLLLVALACAGATSAAGVPRKIVIVGGATSEGPGRHDYPDAVRLLKQWIETSPDVPLDDAVHVDAYPDGWPRDPAAFDGASTVVWYFDGDGRHPLLDAGRRARFESLMAQGVGLVALHQASTLPEGDRSVELARWLGAERRGTFDRTTEFAEFVPERHPVSRGVEPFSYRDEFYPTLRFFDAGGRSLTPILRTTLHVQYRNGASVLDDLPEARTVAWAFERPGGGRSFGFSGGHYVVALDEPALRKLLLNAVFWTAGIEVPPAGVRSLMPDAATDAARAAALRVPEGVADPVPADVLTFHRDAARTGWDANETRLTPERVASSSFGLQWESPPLDSVDGRPPRLYASPLYVDRVEISAGPHRGGTFPVVFAASSSGFVYAINAFKAGDVAPGRILWRTRLGPPCSLRPSPLDGIATGVLATPVIDLARRRLYVTSCDPEERWRAFALDIGSGSVLAGWPVRLDEASLNAVNRNAGAPVAATRLFDFRIQRGALNLSPDGAYVYATFGETETGWLVAVDTALAAVSSAFATQATPHRGGGGIWGAGGPAVDASGRVFVVTGTGFNGFVDRPNDWTQSVLMLSLENADGFVLRGTYTPFNHCRTATMDIDLGSGGVALLPELASPTTTRSLLAVGGKQGNVYLLDRTRLPGQLERRPACSTDPSSDASLLAPGRQPQFGRRGPLNVFGPYSEKDASLDAARARSVPAFFGDASGTGSLFVTGTSRRTEGSRASAAPSLARLEIVAKPGRPAHLRVARINETLVFENPGSPVVTSNGGRAAIVWVLDENARRSASLDGAAAPRPVLYAIDAATLKLLWKSRPGELHASGKYNEPAIARGTVFVGTDRIQAFGLGARTVVASPSADAVDVPAASVGRPEPAPPASVATGTGLVAGQAIYAERCAVCHDYPQGNIPPRRIIASRTQRDIVDTLTRGAMREQALGLSGQAIAAVARFLKRR